jgi:hypothetical protein
MRTYHTIIYSHARHGRYLVVEHFGLPCICVSFTAYSHTRRVAQQNPLLSQGGLIRCHTSSSSSCLPPHRQQATETETSIALTDDIDNHRHCCIPAPTIYQTQLRLKASTASKLLVQGKPASRQQSTRDRRRARPPVPRRCACHFSCPLLHFLPFPTSCTKLFIPSCPPTHEHVSAPPSSNRRHEHIRRQARACEEHVKRVPSAISQHPTARPKLAHYR